MKLTKDSTAEQIKAMTKRQLAEGLYSGAFASLRAHKQRTMTREQLIEKALAFAGK